MPDPRDNVVPFDMGAGFRELPHNDQAEQALLGAVLVDNGCWDQVPDGFAAEDFYVPVHGRIWAACQALIAGGQVASPITLKSYFEADESLAAVGGAQYLARLAGAAVSLISVRDYAELIADLARRRGLILACQEAIEAAYDPRVEDSAAALVERAEAALYGLAEGRGAAGLEDGVTGLAEADDIAIAAFDRAYRSEAGLAGLTTGLAALDNIVGGLAAPDLVVLAGRPGMGKSSLAAGIAMANARAGVPVGFYSFEMGADQIAGRELAQALGVPASDLRRGRIDAGAFPHLLDARRGHAALPFWIDARPAPDIGQLHARARRLQRRHGIGLIVVDYLQLLRSDESRRNDNRVADMTRVTGGLKALAKDLGLPVIAVSQLSRAVEAREDKRPMLADLRESGSIEQDADMVVFLYRDEYYLAHAEPKRRDKETPEHHAARLNDWHIALAEARGRAEAIVAKHRHGPIGAAHLRFDGALTRFTDPPAAARQGDAFDLGGGV